MFNLRFSLRVSKTCLIFVEDKRQYCHTIKLTNVYIMTFYESNEKHGAYNEILILMNSDKSLMNGKLFDKVFELATKQGEIGQQLIEKERNEN
jgi:hypothetical protein